MHRVLIVGSRGSDLALRQSNWVKLELERQLPNREIRLEIIKTRGDKILDTPLSKIGGKGLFTKEIDLALYEKRIDLAVHSLKDIPTQTPEGLTIGAITKREDVQDVFIKHPEKNHASLASLSRGAVIATGSLRRKCQLLHFRSDLVIENLRGNVPSRIQKLDASDWDGIVLAKAGLDRLERSDRITEVLSTDIILPPVGQGALGLEIRSDDDEVFEYVSRVNDAETEIGTRAERALLHHLQGGCQVPIGAYGRIVNDVLRLDAMVGSLDGTHVIRGTVQGKSEEAESMAVKLAETLLQSGGEKILKEIRGTEAIEIPYA
ncbi:MAG: hydroxymethylbilane synthase [Bacteroidota bacterium]